MAHARPATCLMPVAREDSNVPIAWQWAQPVTPPPKPVFLVRHSAQTPILVELPMVVVASARAARADPARAPRRAMNKANACVPSPDSSSARLIGQTRS